MKNLHRNILPILIVVSSLFLSTSVSASEVMSHASNVFKFQQKLALNGNTQAQYKLGFMYETGEGIEADIEQAQQWYDRAAKVGLKSAEHRNTYLMVQALGYNPDMHMAWLTSVKADAADHDTDAMLLLGQLYRQGLGVKKNLKKSLELLTQISVLGAAEVEDEIVAIQDEMAAVKKSRTASQTKKKRVMISKSVQAPVSKMKKTPSVKARQQAVKQPAAVKPQKTAKQHKEGAQRLAAEKAAVKAEKRRRYEQVMKQLQREQQLIDEQQSWSTGGEVASVDDEI